MLQHAFERTHLQLQTVNLVFEFGLPLNIPDFEVLEFELQRLVFEQDVVNLLSAQPFFLPH